MTARGQSGCGDDYQELTLDPEQPTLSSVELLEDRKFCFRIPDDVAALKVAVAPLHGDADTFLSFSPLANHEDASFAMEGVGMEEMLIRRTSDEFCDPQPGEPCWLYAMVYGYHESSFYIAAFKMEDPTVTDILDAECAPGCSHFDLTDMECHPECNTTACLFDGGDCLAVAPVCSPGCMNEYIGDDICDDACFTPECSWDLGDCYQDTEGCSPGCISTYIDDGECDAVCNLEACNYDGEDCFHGHDECFIDPLGHDYRGTLNKTKSGKACQAWTDQFPHQHSFSHAWYPMAGLGGHNYCRNPDGKAGPWCFTTDVAEPWEACEVVQPDECVSNKVQDGARTEEPDKDGKCTDGFYKSYLNTCLPCSECAPGTQERLPCTATMDRVCAPPCSVEANKFDSQGMGALSVVQQVCGETANSTFDAKDNSTVDKKRICSNNCCITYQLALGACNYDGDHQATWAAVRDAIAIKHDKACPAASACASMSDVLQRNQWKEEMGESNGTAPHRRRPGSTTINTGPVATKQAISNPMVATLIAGLAAAIFLLCAGLCWYRRRVKATLLYASPNAPDELERPGEGGN